MFICHLWYYPNNLFWYFSKISVLISWEFPLVHTNIMRRLHEWYFGIQMPLSPKILTIVLIHSSFTTNNAPGTTVCWKPLGPLWLQETGTWPIIASVCATASLQKHPRWLDLGLLQILSFTFYYFSPWGRYLNYAFSGSISTTSGESSHWPSVT